jgi:hypothetical protein
MKNPLRVAAIFSERRSVRRNEKAAGVDGFPARGRWWSPSGSGTACGGANRRLAGGEQYAARVRRGL